MGFARGFDEYDDAFSLDIGMQSWVGETVEGRRFYSLGDEVTARALAMLDSLGGERQFVWIHYFDPHDPYGDCTGEGLPLLEIRRAASAGELGATRLLRAARSGYQRDVGFLDVVIAPLLDRLADAPGAIETHVVFTSDHGESLGEAGVVGHGDHATPEQVHVPTFVVSPRLEPGVRRDVAGSVDLARTLLSLAGVPLELGSGRDLTAPARDPVAALGMRRPLAQPLLYAGIDGRAVLLPELEFFAVRGGDFYRGNAGRLERNGEERDAPDVRGLFAQLAAELERRPARSLEDPQTREALRALGYVD